MSKTYNRTPSELHGVEGAAGLCFDTGIFIFANWVEGEMQSAEASAQNEMFARSNRARAFARCMGDDMETSTAGFADPFADGSAVVVDESPTANRKRRKPFADIAEDAEDDEVLGLEEIV
jgi:hypothetical protein